MGLSMFHKRTRFVSVQGGVLKVSPAFGSGVAVGAARGKCTGFSRASRKRMIEKILTIDLDACGRGLFVTLTYPEEFPTARESKRHLKAFFMRLRRRYPVGMFFVWRLELQERGAPHYHLLVFGVDFIPRDWLSGAWYEIVGSGDEKHLKAGTNVEKMKTKNGAVWYCSKYMTKETEDDLQGRAWGVMGRENVKYHELESFWLSEDDAESLSVLYEAQVMKRADKRHGFSLYGSMGVYYFNTTLRAKAGTMGDIYQLCQSAEILARSKGGLKHVKVFQASG
jgi:hypothetical protein